MNEKQESTRPAQGRHWPPSTMMTDNVLDIRNQWLHWWVTCVTKALWVSAPNCACGSLHAIHGVDILGIKATGDIT